MDLWEGVEIYPLPTKTMANGFGSYGSIQLQTTKKKPKKKKKSSVY